MNNKNELLSNLESVLSTIRHKRKTVKQIKDVLSKYKISGGDVQLWINNLSVLVDKEKELLLFTDAIFIVSGNMNLNPQKYWTTRQIKEVKTNYTVAYDERLKFPLTLENAIRVSDDMYYIPMTDRFLKKLMDSGLIQYNSETQRDPKIKTKDGELISQPRLIMKSVKEIKQLRKTGQLFSTVLTFNARLGSSDVGEEVIYNADEFTLTITEGTLLDSLDGFHRLNGIIQALIEDPNLDEQVFMVCIVNYDIITARKWFSQVNTTNPIPKSRLNEMNQDNLANFIAKQLQVNSELRGKVSSSDRIASSLNYLVSFNVLSQAIGEVYNLKEKPEAIRTSKYLTDFFNQLVLNFYDEFHSNIVEVRKNSLVNTNQMFYGYVILAKRMQDENIPLDQLSNIISSINFNRNNSIWYELGIVDADGNIRNNVKSKIKQFFSNIELQKVEA